MTLSFSPHAKGALERLLCTGPRGNDMWLDDYTPEPSMSPVMREAASFLTPQVKGSQERRLHAESSDGLGEG